MHCMCMKMLQLGPKANQLTGFYIRATLALNGLRNTQAIEVQFIKKLDNSEAGLKKKAFSVKKTCSCFFRFIFRSNYTGSTVDYCDLFSYSWRLIKRI